MNKKHAFFIAFLQIISCNLFVIVTYSGVSEKDYHLISMTKNEPLTFISKMNFDMTPIHLSAVSLPQMGEGTISLNSQGIRSHPFSLGLSWFF